MDKLLKRTLVFLLAVTPCFLSEDVRAACDDPLEIEPIKIDSSGEVINPRSIAPECYYQDGYVYIVADSSVTSISGTVTRLTDNAQWSDSSTGNMLQIAVPTDAGTYRLTLTLSDGSSYYGDYALTL